MKSEHLKHSKSTKGRKFYNEFYTKEEIMSLIKQCNNGSSGLRNKAIIIVLYRCGMSVSEVLAILPSDYNSNESTIRVAGKSNKNRIIGIDSQTKINLDLWISKRKKLGINEEGNFPIFCGISKHNFGKNIRGVYIRNLLKRLAKKVGIKKRVNPNNFRHTFVHDLLNENIEIQHIQSSLGHSNVATTSKYLQRFNPIQTVNTLKSRNW